MNADQTKTKALFSDLRSSALDCGLLLFITGCCTTKTREAYYGKTLTMDQVVGIVNTNNQMIPTLNANIDFDVEVTTDGKKDGVSGSGTINYRRPGDLLLRGSKEFVGPIFEIGSNKNSYWMTLIPKVETAWYGSYKNLGKPCVQNLPIQPDMLVEVLGISTFNTNFLEQPVPVMRFNHEEDAYEFTWNIRLADRWAAKKMVRYDRSTQQPTQVSIFDENARTILKAELSEPVAIEAPELPKDRLPKIASKYDLLFPESQMHLTLKLNEVVLKKGRIPSDITFRMPERDKFGVQKEVIQVDKDCDD